METGLKGKTVLITGASRNMGRAAALGFAADGANLALCTSTKIDELEQVANEARRSGVSVLAAKCDVADAAAVSNFVKQAAADFGSVDVLVNLAGFRCEAPFLEETSEAWQRNIEVNLTGPFLTCRAVLPLMIQNRWGRIINVSGVSPYTGGAAAKAMVKLGIVGLTRGLAREFGPHNITANCVGPGAIARDTDPAGTKPVSASLPLGRKGSYAEMVSLIVYLASENAGYITGQSYLANGGAYFN